ncbi:uncharacterized protein E6C27_scaffold160G00420 [Cucumis melo var. makuwa]|uniref:Uncharacterized protein n=1 Tax=Cucumis melo var. makuwa TaxID=1194695 RepID=A0A5A7UVS1_CUCMM|nr:uncharacterized protein E6C27_scaffold160G00420 [Cucumis melo var. makuwa]
MYIATKRLGIPGWISSFLEVISVEKVFFVLEGKEKFSRIHDGFHVSMMRKYILDLSYVLQAQPMELKEDLSYEEEEVQIVDKKRASFEKQDEHTCESSLDTSRNRGDNLGVRRQDEEEFLILFN